MTNLGSTLDLIKAKRAPIGTVSNGKEKVAEGKWVPVKSGAKGSKQEEEVDHQKNHDQEEAGRHMSEALKYKELQSKLEDGIKQRKEIDPDYEAPSAVKEKLDEVKAKTDAHSSDLKDKKPKENKAAKEEANQKEITPEEKEAVQEYKNAAYGSAIGGFTTIQGYLRDGKPKFGKANAEEKKAAMDYAEKLSSAINKSPLKKDTKFYRGLKSKKGDEVTEAIYNLKPGDSFSDKGFTSATSSTSVANRFSEKLNRSDNPIKMQFELPKGYPALEVKSALGGKDAEKEFILDKSSQFEVKSVKDSSGTRIITLVPKGSMEKSLRDLHKSLIMADMQGSAIDTADYNKDLEHAQDWLEVFQTTMEGYDYGDAPREIMLDKGYSIILSKVDDGLYSGFIRQSIDWNGDSPLEETASKVEKQTLPTIISFLKAKEYIDPLLKEKLEVLSEADTPKESGVAYADAMDAYGEAIEDQEVAYQIGAADEAKEHMDSNVELATKLVNLLDRLI